MADPTPGARNAVDHLAKTPAVSGAGSAMARHVLSGVAAITSHPSSIRMHHVLSIHVSMYPCSHGCMHASPLLTMQAPGRVHSTAIARLHPPATTLHMYMHGVCKHLSCTAPSLPRCHSLSPRRHTCCLTRHGCPCSLPPLPNVTRRTLDSIPRPRQLSTNLPIAPLG